MFAFDVGTGRVVLWHALTSFQYIVMSGKCENKPNEIYPRTHLVYINMFGLQYISTVWVDDKMQTSLYSRIWPKSGRSVVT